MDIFQGLRVLRSSGDGLDRKHKQAVLIRRWLLEDAARGRDHDQRIPCRVWSHCAGQLLEWLSSALDDQIRVQPVNGGFQSSSEPSLQTGPSLWQLFADVLSSAQQLGRAVAVPDVVSSLASCCQKAAGSAQCSAQPSHQFSDRSSHQTLEQPSQEQYHADPDAMICILGHLHMRRAENLLSSVEHSVALAEAALAAAAAQMGTWTELASCAVTSCTAACTRSLNQRKVFEASTQRLMRAILPHLHSPNDPQGRQPDQQLRAACVQLLEVGIFHSSHIPGLAEASTESYHLHVSVTGEAACAQAPRSKPDKRSTDKQSLTSYHWQFFQALDQILSSQQQTAGFSPHLPALLLNSFCQAARASANSAEAVEAHSIPVASAEAELQAKGRTGLDPSADLHFFMHLLVLVHKAQQAAHDSFFQQQGPSATDSASAGGLGAFQGKGQMSNELKSADSAGKSASQQALSEKAVVKAARKARKRSKAARIDTSQATVGPALSAAARWTRLAATTASLLKSAQQLAVYRPNEDTTGSNRALLAQLATDTSLHVTSIRDNGNSEAVETLNMLRAGISVWSALLALEHRAVQPLLKDLWQWCIQYVTPQAGSCQEHRRATHSQATALQQLLCHDGIRLQLQDGFASLPSGQVPMVVQHAAEVLMPFAVTPDSPKPAVLCAAQLATACFLHVQVTGPQADALAAQADAALQVIGADLAEEAKGVQASAGSTSAEPCTLLKLAQGVFEKSATAGTKSVALEASHSSGLECVLLNLCAARLQWLQEQLLRLQYTCPQPDLPDAEDTQVLPAYAQSLQLETNLLAALMAQQATIASSLYMDGQQGPLDAALACQEQYLPIITNYLEVLLARAPAASLAALAESVLLTVSCLPFSHPSAKACRTALHRMLMAQQPSMQAAWSLALQRALECLMQQCLQGGSSARPPADVPDLPPQTGSPHVSASASSTAKSTSTKSKKRQLGAASQTASASPKKLKRAPQIVEEQLSFDKKLSVAQLSTWSNHLTAAQSQCLNAAPKSTTASSPTADIYSRRQLDACANLTSLFWHVRLIAQSHLPSAVSSGLVSGIGDQDAQNAEAVDVLLAWTVGALQQRVSLNVQEGQALGFLAACMSRSLACAAEAPRAYLTGPQQASLQSISTGGCQMQQDCVLPKARMLQLEETIMKHLTGQDEQAFKPHGIHASLHLFAAAAHCLRCHVAYPTLPAAVQSTDSEPSPVLDLLPQLVQQASSFLQQYHLGPVASAGHAVSDPDIITAACSGSDAAQLVQLLEAAALVGPCQHAKHPMSAQGNPATDQRLSGPSLACSPDELLQTQLSLLKSPVPCPQPTDSPQAASGAVASLPYNAALHASQRSPLRASLLKSIQTCLAGQDQQQRTRLHAALLNTLPNPSSAVDSLPLFELALLALETRTAFTVEDSHHTLSSKTANAFAAATSDGITGLAALLPVGVGAWQHNASAAAIQSCTTYQRTLHPAAPSTEAAVQAQDAHTVTAAAAQPRPQAASQSDEAIASLLQAHPATGPWRGSVPAPGSSPDVRSPMQQTDGSAPDSETGAFLLGICTGLQCLQSLAARDRAFQLAPESVARMAHLPWQLLQTRDVWGWHQCPKTGQAVVVACCNLLAALLRHRAKGLRRCMTLVAASCRRLLQQLAAWLLQTGKSSADKTRAMHDAASWEHKQQETNQEHAAEALQPAFKALGRVFTALADQKEVLGRYALPVLADYVATAGLAAQAQVRFTKQGSLGVDCSLGNAVAVPLRSAACALYGVCSASQVQHLHATLSGAAQGLAQAALSELRTEFEGVHKYTGKA
ncbi:hypothetical protein WJX74_005055 [Apatococcus lobatus]|uniref:Nucleolar 27S pre-rRNA processing Urb2/Npa2 C-terminal domain-containing protein n=1 Tax=Apatococcus lobatus TaxID=904363 RepID=A0AAW1QXS0_9CHLO